MAVLRVFSALLAEQLGREGQETGDLASRQLAERLQVTALSLACVLHSLFL